MSAPSQRVVGFRIIAALRKLREAFPPRSPPPPPLPRPSATSSTRRRQRGEALVGAIAVARSSVDNRARAKLRAEIRAPSGIDVATGSRFPGSLI